MRSRPRASAQVAGRLEVSERTIYRDVADLIGSGVRIEGEAGVGYVLGEDFDLPPVVFDASEVQAPVLGMRRVEAWGDGELRGAIDARRVLELDDADAEGAATTREVCPLGLWSWGRTWTLGAWCELRADQRNFRLDRVHALRDTGRTFEAVEPRTLEAYVRCVSDE